MDNLLREYGKRKATIVGRLNDFRLIKEKDYFNELLFCLLTPQSNAKKCWDAVLELKKTSINGLSEKQIASVLKSRTRFHNNKARYIKKAIKQWPVILEKIEVLRAIELRNWMAENVDGIGYKEAGHFIRNIGKSDNKVAILDRHILRNLCALNVISNEKLKGKKNYFEVEDKFIDFSSKIGIPIDELDLLFWSRENGEVFK